MLPSSWDPYSNALLSACARGPARTDNDTTAKLWLRTKRSVSTEVVRNGQEIPRRVLITYFTYPDNTDAQAIHSKEYDVMASASLNNKRWANHRNDAMIANEIARRPVATSFSILAEKPYSADYDAMIRDEKAAPRNEKRELKSHVGDMSGYDTVVLVYPFGGMPAGTGHGLPDGKRFPARPSMPSRRPVTATLSILSKTLPSSSPMPTSMKASSSVMMRWMKRPMPFASDFERRIS